MAAAGACQYCRKSIDLYKCFSCMKVSAFVPGNWPGKCPKCFTMVRSGLPLPPTLPRAAVSAAIAAPIKTVEELECGIAIDSLSRSIVYFDTFATFIKQAIAELNSIAIGREFLSEFAPGRVGLHGAPRYPNSTVVIKPPTAAKPMPSVAETSGLQFFKPCPSPLLDQFVGQGTVTYLSNADMLALGEHAVLKPEFEKRAKKAAEEPNVCLKINAYTDAKSVKELQAHSTQEVLADPGGGPATGQQKIRFNLLLECFSPRPAHVRDELKAGSKQPANLYVYWPGSAWKETPIQPDGDFLYHGQHYNLREVVIHELIHCYQIIYGYGVGTPENDDEKRTVGIYQYKNYKYSENVFRVAWGVPLRLDYPRLGILKDPDLTGKPPAYDYTNRPGPIFDNKTAP